MLSSHSSPYLASFMGLFVGREKLLFGAGRELVVEFCADVIIHQGDGAL